MILRVVSNSKNSNRNDNTQSQAQNNSRTSSKNSNSSGNSRTGDWDNHPEVWSEANNNDMWKGTIYENMTPQDRYNYQTDNANHWASVEGIQH